MRAAEARKLIGKNISWNERRDVVDLVHPPLRKGTLKDVQGKNAQVDVLGSLDWKWLPDMVNLREAHPAK